MRKILNILNNHPVMDVMMKNKGTILVNEISEAYLIAGRFLRSHESLLIVKENSYQAMQLYQYIKELVPETCYFPSDESLRVESVAYSYELLGERINAMNMLASDTPCICICHMHSFIRYITPLPLFQSSIINLSVGDRRDPLELRSQLLKMGYQMTQRVDSPFYIARRGEVLDIYSIQYDQPVRIEFFDDEIESIHFYNKDHQRREESLKTVTILPATDMLYEESEIQEVETKIRELYNVSTLEEEVLDNLKEVIEIDIESLKAHDYNPRIYQYLHLFSQTGCIKDYKPGISIIYSHKENIINNYQRFTEENFYYFEDIISIGQMVKGLKLVYTLNEVMSEGLYLENFALKYDASLVTESVLLNHTNQTSMLGQLRDESIMNSVLLCVETKSQIQHLIELFDENQISYTITSNDDHIYKGINIYMGHLPVGIHFVEERTLIYTSHELFPGTSSKKKYVKYKDARVIHNYTELEIGDYVVHDANGIGQYMGIKTLEMKGVHKDYLYISYKGNDVLYVPVENFHLIRKYTSRDGRVPKIHKLGDASWQKEKARVRAKVDGLADELIELYAQRLQSKGYAFPSDDAMQIQFESEFGYELTADQKRSLDEIKADMMDDKPMDRLLCGDVGFGKTEVALRACFKAILAGKQCAFLCPTTILSHQHYKTMKERFKNYPVSIAVLNRFTGTKERREILQKVKEGKIDILVGTHRILSKDVSFKDLGLLCIDEEQRFGVRQKEKIKELRRHIDVLVLTATPIPRTLQMSLMGVRGLSQIETPPLNRLPVQTYVNERSVPLIKQVIERELARNGQVFYLYNRTDRIEAIANELRTLLPHARIGIGHGQMKKDQLENVMQAFVDHEYDILVCTTIIETGIDIPNANTIIIEDADRFGLAQLYQIKGRVGRSERIAYAYLFYRKNKMMNEEATKRLKAIKEFTQLGSGYKIAMRDLSIRGSGDILGSEQAGFIDTVGFDMYMKILQDAINEKRGVKEETVIPSSNVPIDGYIPENYVDSDVEKINLYSRIFNTNSLKELHKVEVELIDYYGELPREVKNIVLKRQYDLLSNDYRIDSIVDKDTYTITFTKEYSDEVDGVRLFGLANERLDRPKLSYKNNKISISIRSKDDYLMEVNTFLNTLFQI